MALSTSGITTTLVANALGSASRNIGALCTHQNVNKWSKHKPVIQARDSNDGFPTWWKASDGKCGLDIPEFTSITSLINYYNTTPELWTYKKPTGSESSPFRLGDFRGYEHSAQPPLLANQMADTYNKSIVNLPTSLNIRATSTTELSVNDIGTSFNLGNGYFGVALANRGTTTQRSLTDSSIIGTGEAGGVQIPLTSVDVGLYTVFMFISSVMKTTFNGTDPIGGKFVPIPNGVFNIQIKAGGLTVILTGSKLAKRVDWSLNIVNSDNVTKSLQNVRVMCRYGDKSESDSFESGEDFIVIGNITVGANSTYTNSGSFSNALTNIATRGGYIAFTNTNDTALNERFYIGDNN